MRYKVKYNTYCPKCLQEGNDKHMNNLAVYEHGSQYCFAGHGFLTTPEEIREPFFPKKQYKTESRAVDEYLEGIGEINHPDIIKYLWSMGLIYADWQYYNLKQIEDGYYSKDNQYIPISLGVIIPMNEDSFIIRKVGVNPLPKVINSHFTKFYKVSNSWSNKLVFVEDAFSAMKVHKAGFNCIALLGTSLKEETKTAILRLVTCNQYYIWLDNDKAGRIGEEKLQRYLQLLHPPTIIHTEKDPKYYSVSQIKELIV